jgi:REP element-mobilizing transposase RayT
MKTHYERRLPHTVPPGAVVFFTFRLAGSIAAEAWQQLFNDRELTLREARQQAAPVAQQAEILNRQQKRRFAACDALLDQANQGPVWLREARIAEVVVKEIHALSELEVVIVAYCLMANHVHLVVQLPDAIGFSAARMMQRLKGRTALAANKLLGRPGQAFWQHESYDHVVRNGEEQARVVAYVVNNPVKAGLVEKWTQWPYMYMM